MYWLSNTASDDALRSAPTLEKYTSREEFRATHWLLTVLSHACWYPHPQLSAMATCCQPIAAARPTALTSVFGISGVLAAKILGHVGDISRFGSADRFTSYSGTAPIEVSSG